MDTQRFVAKIARIAALCVLGVFMSSVTAFSAPQPGDILPKVKLQKPSKSEELKYLGLSGSGSFALTDISAKIVIVEFYSMYCPYCQAEAPNTVKLYGNIRDDAALVGTVKVIGVGVGNSDYEVDLFRNKYAIPFPLFSDEDFTMVEALGLQYTPHFIVIRIDEKGKAHVVYSQSGSIGDPREFLNKITHP
jgi:peroxiredoxin